MIVDRSAAVNNNEVNVLHKTLADILCFSGITPDVSGYVYLKDSILMVYDNSGLDYTVTKEIYPCVAKKRNVTPEVVEMRIRSAITRAWKKKGGNGFYAKMGICGIKDNRRPTNSEYIYIVAEYLRTNIME
ncbi:MAG: sporulation initiation factor Spo0A C-terminal domain-containing protein [Clostridia bacterium]|nr:sporulation initiation factor Spo0A C-terminal domain-containing protein [Clostridia bacterium]